MKTWEEWTLSRKNSATEIIHHTLQEAKNQLLALLTDVASSKKANKDKLIKTLEVAKKTLIDTLQEELSNTIESASEETKEKFREDTIKQLIHFLKEDELHTPKSKDWTEPVIYISVLQTLTKQTQGRWHAIYLLILDSYSVHLSWKIPRP